MQGPLKQIVKQQSLGAMPYASMLLRGQDDAASVLKCAGTLFIHGARINVHHVNSFNVSKEDRPAFLVDLPPYPWDHSQSYWAESRISRGYRFRKHPRLSLLGAPVSDYNSLGPRWRNFLSILENPWIRDHQVQHSILYPAAGMIAMVLEAAIQIADPNKTIEKIRLRDCKIGKAIVIPDSNAAVEVMLQMRHEQVGSENSMAYWSEFSIFSYSDDDATEENCTGFFSIVYKAEELARVSELESDLEKGQYRQSCLEYEKLCALKMDPGAFYEQLTSLGLNYGPAFQNVTAIRHGSDRSLCTIKVPDTKTNMSVESEESHLLHPATLDCIFQTLFAAINDGRGSFKEAAVPTFIDSIEISANIPHVAGSEFYGLTNAKRHGLREISADITMSEKVRAEPSIVIKGFRCKELSALVDSSSKNDEPAFMENKCLKVSSKPDITLMSSIALKQLMEHAVDGSAPNALDKVVKKNLAAFIFIEWASKAITPDQISKDHLRLFFTWMRSQHQEAPSNNSQSPYILENSAGLSEAEKNNVISEVEALDGEGRTICRIGRNLQDILTSRIEPLELLLEDDLLSQYYQEAAGMSVLNKKLGPVSDLISCL